MPLSIMMVAVAEHSFGFANVHPVWVFVPGFFWGRYVFPQAQRYVY